MSVCFCPDLLKVVEVCRFGLWGSVWDCSRFVANESAVGLFGYSGFSDCYNRSGYMHFGDRCLDRIDIASAEEVEEVDNEEPCWW